MSSRNRDMRKDYKVINEKEEDRSVFLGYIFVPVSLPLVLLRDMR